MKGRADLLDWHERCSAKSNLSTHPEPCKGIPEINNEIYSKTSSDVQFPAESLISIFRLLCARIETQCVVDCPVDEKLRNGWKLRKKIVSRQKDAIELSRICLEIHPCVCRNSRGTKIFSA